MALGVGLRAAGHVVTVAAPTPFRAFVEERGLVFADLAADPRAIVESELGQAWLASGHNPLAFIRRLEAIVAPHVGSFLTDLLAACRDAERIVYSPLAIAAWHIGEAYGIPTIYAPLVPSWRTRALPHPLAPPLPVGPVAGAYNWLSHVAVERAAWQIFRQLANRWRTETLGLPPVSRLRLYRRMVERGDIMLHGFSRHVISRPRDWPDWARVSGYWFLDRPAEWSPPTSILDFLNDGPPPVYIGLGSMASGDPTRFTDIALAALRRAGQRGMLLSGWAGLGQADLPDDVCLVDDVPHDWLFPHMSAVVHHGGAGTTAAGLRASRPTVTLPFFADQPFWGRRVSTLGAGPPPIMQRAVTVENLTRAIQQATTDPEMARRAAVLGARIRAEDGVGNAVRLISGDRELR